MFSRKRPSSVTPSQAESVASTPLTPSTSSASQYRPVRGNERIRQPDKNIGIARLLEVYDDYPRLEQELETTFEQLQLAEDQARDAEEQREVMRAELQEEQAGRAKDAETAKVEKKKAEESVDKKVRGELDPKIKALETKLKAAEVERDQVKKELSARTTGMSKWILELEKLDKERVAAEERESKAAEDRKKLDGKLKELDKTILEGMRNWTKKPETEDATVLPASTSTKATSTKAASTKVTSAGSASAKADQVAEKL